MVAAFVPEQRRDAFCQAIFDAEQPCLTGDAEFGERLSAVLEEWNLEASYARLVRVFNDIHVDEEVLRLVETIRRSGVMCCVASNQQTVRANHMSAVLGYARHFDHAFYSHALGVAKPDMRYFRRILAALALHADQVLFIDDSEPNVRAASAVGLRAAHFPSNSGSERMRQFLRQHGVGAA